MNAKVIAARGKTVQRSNLINIAESHSKKHWLARATIGKINIESMLGERLYIQRFTNKNGYEFATIPPIEKIDHVSGNIYKIETRNAVYVTEISIRTTESF